MLYYKRIDVSEGIDINNTSASKECTICHYWYFLGKGFTFEPTICNDCHGVLMMAIETDSIAISNIDDMFIIVNILLEAIRLLKNDDEWKKL